jgi:hypothetical protein
LPLSTNNPFVSIVDDDLATTKLFHVSSPTTTSAFLMNIKPVEVPSNVTPNDILMCLKMVIE